MDRQTRGSGADDFILTVFGWFQPLFANVYVGLAERARDLAIERVKKKTSVAMAPLNGHHPEVQHMAARIFYELEAMTPGRADRGRLDEQG